jgi:hypothetical protein
MVLVLGVGIPEVELLKKNGQFPDVSVNVKENQVFSSLV